MLEAQLNIGSEEFAGLVLLFIALVWAMLLHLAEKRQD
jgi:hypothetical protein